MLAKFIIGIVITAMIGIPALASDRQGQDGNNQDGDSQGNLHVVHAVPGPVAGVGLPVLLAAGGYVLWRRRKRGAGKDDTTP